MGKATRWFRALLGSKNTRDSGPKSGSKSRSSAAGNENSSGAPPSSPYSERDANRHAIAVAAATAAVAEAALAAAQAAAEVVRLTSTPGTRNSSSTAAYASRDRRRELAAITIQSAFRAYLAKRALRALKGLVKLQAIVRGRIVRKQTADMLRRMQAMARIQARACSNRAVLEPSHQLLNSMQHRRAGSPSRGRHESPQRYHGNRHERVDHKRRMPKPNPNSSIKLEGLHLGSSWLDRWMEECAWNDQKEASISNVSRDEERSVKILEIDTWKPTHNQRQRERHRVGQRAGKFDPLSGHEKANPSVSSSGDALSLRSLKFPPQEEQTVAWTAENSPYLHSASSSRRGPFTPTRSECSRSVFAEYMSHPSYMASTESYLAKVRSQSAPRQRMQHDGTNRSSVPGLWDQDSLSEKGSATPSNVRSKGYRSSGLNRVGTPMHYPG